MKIVVLDGYALNPGDLSWGHFESLGECVVHERTPASETVSRASGAEIILTNKTLLTREIIEQLPDLRYIGVLATGYNVVDTEAAAERGIPVTNVPEYSTSSVVQMVFAHLMAFTSHVSEHSASVRKGNWSNSKDFCFWEYPLPELSGMTMGIVGLGRIGSAVATVAMAFGMDVLAYNPSVKKDISTDIVMTDIESVFKRSDVVTLHCPLTDDNKEFVDARLLGLMKKTAFLINTSRGPVIDEQALADALNSGEIAGAGLDVLTEEPPASDCPLLTADNCYVTPHIAWATLQSRQRLMNTAFENAQSFVNGKTINAVNSI